jgi:hypothetical protein
MRWEELADSRLLSDEPARPTVLAINIARLLTNCCAGGPARFTRIGAIVSCGAI